MSDAVASALKEIGTLAVEPLVTALRDKNPKIRREAARVLLVTPERLKL